MALHLAVLGSYALVQAAFEGMIIQLLPLRLANEEWLPKAIIKRCPGMEHFPSARFSVLTSERET